MGPTTTARWWACWALLALGAARPTAQADPAAALLELKGAVPRGSPLLASWTAGSDPCSSSGWEGVRCTNGVVTALSLRAAGLRGTLPPALAGLSTLRELDLGEGNQLTGTLPQQWSQLAGLERVSLAGNQLRGTLPAGWNALASLKVLDLAGNHLTGVLPAAWASMAGLAILDLARNNLTGTLPGAWSRQPLLSQIDLSHNQLAGTLPPSWAALHSLLQLDLSSNDLSGTLPRQWGGLRQVTLLSLARNQLTGALPAKWADLRPQVLSLAGNQLTGEVPSQWSTLASRVYQLDLANNSGLCGALAAALARALGPSARRGTALASTCAWQSDADALLALKAAVAKDSWPLLASWQQGANPCSPSAAWRGVACVDGAVTTLNLTGMRLIISSLEPLVGLAALEQLVLAGSSVQGVLPESWAQLRRLRVLDASGTGVTGRLPESWQALQVLEHVSLAGNALEGSLPAAWAALGSLTTLVLAGNNLTGELPRHWAGLLKLQVLDAGDNELSGALPGQWETLQALQVLKFAGNQLSGPIPAGWQRLAALQLVDLKGNLALCGGAPSWARGPATLLLGGTNIEQSCLLATASGALVGTVIGVAAAATLAGVLTVGVLLVHVRQQRDMLAQLQRERSMASFPSMQSLQSGGGKPAATTTVGEEHALDRDFIKVSIEVPEPPSSAELGSPASTDQQHEHRSPSPQRQLASPLRMQWQGVLAAQERGVDLVARRGEGRRLFRSRSEATHTLGQQQQQQQHQPEEGEEEHLGGVA